MVLKIPLKSIAWVEINFIWLPSGANLAQNEMLVPSITLKLHKANGSIISGVQDAY
jgi:hypothetical protein